MSTQTSPQWGTLQAAAAAFQIHERTLRRMIARGEIEARRFGPRLIRVNLASIEAAGRPLQFGGGDAA
ncbi:helix-turn-helix domain-containing protein [Microbacterium lacus]|uniref:helix-turn-helix domain-containing protein n=1 Tax=Microbacterium lacus TaxID=415217 RepID=UPI000C2B6500|nr:helix-turn-helix domain-containing protein [Microbacterium lacus]